MTTAAHVDRRHARVVSFQSDPDGRLTSFEVRCPYCRGRHAHSARRSTEYAHAWCGTPAGAYEVLWPPTPLVNTTPEPADTSLTTALAPEAS